MQTDPKERLEQFQRENGMSIETAWEKVCEWKLAGKTAEVRSGCKQILKYFPEHPAKKTLEELDKKNEKTASGFGTVVNTLLGTSTEEEANSESETEKEETETEKETTEKNAPPKRREGLFSTSLSRKKDPSLPEENSVEDDERVFAALSYLPFLCILILIARKKSRFIYFHAQQGTTIFVSLLITSLFFPLLYILGPIVHLYTLFYFLYVCIIFFAAWTAWHGKYIEIPLISEISRSVNL